MEEKRAEPFLYDGRSKPQIIVIGNGLERIDDNGSTEPGSLREAGKGWDDLIQSLKASDPFDFKDEELKSVPFPLKYHLLSSSSSAPYPLRAKDRRDEQKRLTHAMQSLGTMTNPALRRLPTLGADDIYTTNYTYSLERAFYPKKNMLNSRTRRGIRFNYATETDSDGNPTLERVYRLHTGYTASNRNKSPVRLWHIHGECSVPESIILGHDGYGRLLNRIVNECGNHDKYRAFRKGEKCALLTWPELFLFGDVYILGLGLGFSEFDLWWLLRRKQREEKGFGRVYFYTNDSGEDHRDRDLMLKALGVIINPGILQRGIDHNEFYALAMDDIKAGIAKNRDCRNFDIL